MKKWIVVFVICVVGLAAWFFLSRNKAEQPSTSPDRIVSGNAAAARTPANPNSNTVAIVQSNLARVQPAEEVLSSATAGITHPPAGPPEPLQWTNISPEIVLANMSRAVRQFGTMFGGNPVGTNPEITSQLSGNNPKHINFLNAEAGMRVNADGELVDPWGTPYFFHQLSGTDMEIHSAGPDKIMWTADDLVTK